MNQFKKPTNRVIKLSRCLLLALPMLSVAHPDAEIQGRFLGAGDPPIPSAASSRATKQQQVNKVPLPEAVKRGYKNNVMACIGQVSHEHKVSEDEKSPNPVEIWYISTRKTTKESPGKPYYCVAPRVESASSESWAKSFEVRLIAVDPKGSKSDVRDPVPVKGISAGESREVFSHCVQGTAPRNWIIDTPHGWAEVVFPQPGGQKGPSCGGIASGRSE